LAGVTESHVPPLGVNTVADVEKLKPAVELEICKVCPAGAEPLYGWVKVREAGDTAAVAVDEITTVTGITVGMLPAAVGVTVTLPV
jgi:hypothetical protein